MSPPRVTPGLTITETECDVYLATDLAPVEAAINTLVKVPLSQNEFDAMASWLFNEGVGALRKSQLLKRLNVGDIAGAADDFMSWCKPASLAGRRAEEKAQFLTPDAPNAAGVSRSSTVAAIRAQTLAVRATAAKSKARTNQTGGAAVALGGGAAALAISQGGGGHLALWIAGIVFVGAAIDVAVALVQHLQSATLAGNASRQVVAAATLAKGAAPATAVPSGRPSTSPQTS